MVTVFDGTPASPMLAGSRPQRWRVVASLAAALAYPPLPVAAQSETAAPRPTLEQILEMKSVDAITLSPDGRKLAFRVISPSIPENRTLIQWFAVPVDGSAPAVPFGKPTEPTLLPMFDAILDEVPIWSADGRSLYVRLLQDSAVQVHRVGANGEDALITNDRADIVTFRITPDGKSLHYEVRNDRSTIDAAVHAEEHQGVHFDRGVSAEGSRITRNLRIGNRESTMRYASSGGAEELNLGPLRQKSIDLDTPPRSSGHVLAAELGGRTDTLVPKNDGDMDRWVPVGPTGLAVALKETVPAKPYLYTRHVQIVARLRNGRLRSCNDVRCSNSAAMIRQVIPVDRLGEIAILYEKDYSGRTGIYLWNPVTDRMRSLVAADQALDGGASYGANRCVRLDDLIFCARSNPTRPVDLVSIDLASGKIVPLASPNADLARLRHFPGRYLEWFDRDGNAANGILVLPDTPSGPLPLVITSYRCRGYLQGSMGKLAAEQMLVDRGFAVLCVNANNAVGMDVADPGFANYMGQLHAYEAIVAQLAKDGVIDKNRVGMAGHSGTSMVAAIALSTTDLFQAVVIGTGITVDPATFMFTEPTTDSWRKGILQFFKMPNPVLDMKPWEAISPALNAKRITAPLLIQPPENEYLLALQLFGAMQQTGGTVDMYVYPNEGHTIGREPLHQLWRNRRSIDWFSFWLLNEKRPSPATAQQFEHWQKLKERRDSQRR